MDAVFSPQIDFILKRGSGIKACLFDSETKQMISNIIPLSSFQDNGFFYFDYITNKNRTKVSGMTCVVILRPENLRMLLEEIVCPFYGNYIVLFTSQIDPFTLEIMANSDIHSIISEVHEINLELCRQSYNLYLTNSTKQKRSLDSILSILLTKNINPTILSTPENESFSSLLPLGREISNKLTVYNLDKKGSLFLIDRSFDLITPLLYDWHYQSMINEHFNIDNSVIKVNNKSFILNDQFYNENKFNQITAVGESIRKLVEEFGSRKLGIDDFDEIQGRIHQKNIAEMHLTIYNKLIEEAMKIQTVSETQNTMLNSKEFDIFKITADCDSDNKCLQILLVYFLKYVKNWDETSKLFPKYRTDLMRFYELMKPKSFCYKNRFDSSVDPKLGYISPLSRIVKHYIQDKLKENSFVKMNINDEKGPLIIYIQGGVTMREYREMIAVSEEFKIEIIVISDEILTISRFLNKSKL